jgi:hypothetical protein
MGELDVLLIVLVEERLAAARLRRRLLRVARPGVPPGADVEERPHGPGGKREREKTASALVHRRVGGSFGRVRHERLLGSAGQNAVIVADRKEKSRCGRLPRIRKDVCSVEP